MLNKIIENRIEQVRATLAYKQDEYAGGRSQFHNFDTAGRILNTTREKALKGMWIKHIVSVMDLIEFADTAPEKLNEKLIDEKIGDSINYLIILEAMLKDRL